MHLNRQHLCITWVLALGCAPCWPGGQPDCKGSHTIRVEDEDGARVYDYKGRIDTLDGARSIEVNCREGDYTSTPDYACSNVGLTISPVEGGVVVQLESLDGTQMAAGEYTLEITPATDSCDCARYETHTLILSETN